MLAGEFSVAENTNEHVSTMNERFARPEGSAISPNLTLFLYDSRFDRESLLDAWSPILDFM